MASGGKDESGTPTMFSDIVYKNGQYVPVGLDPFLASLPGAPVDERHWRRQERAARDESGSRRGEMLGLPRRKEAARTPSSNGFVPCLRSTGFEWLGDPSNMTHTGVGDAHRCSSCGLIVSEYVQGDTFLNQHAFFSGGECPYLKANYTAERLAVEIGQARFAKGLVAHPEAIWVPDAWNRPGPPELSRGIYVTLTAEVIKGRARPTQFSVFVPSTWLSDTDLPSSASVEAPDAADARLQEDGGERSRLDHGLLPHQGGRLGRMAHLEHVRARPKPARGRRSPSEGRRSSFRSRRESPRRSPFGAHREGILVQGLRPRSRRALSPVRTPCSVRPGQRGRRPTFSGVRVKGVQCSLPGALRREQLGRRRTAARLRSALLFVASVKEMLEKCDIGAPLCAPIALSGCTTRPARARLRGERGGGPGAGSSGLGGAAAALPRHSSAAPSRNYTYHEFNNLAGTLTGGPKAFPLRVHRPCDRRVNFSDSELLPEPRRPRGPFACRLRRWGSINPVLLMEDPVDRDTGKVVRRYTVTSRGHLSTLARNSALENPSDAPCYNEVFLPGRPVSRLNLDVDLKCCLGCSARFSSGADRSTKTSVSRALVSSAVAAIAESLLRLAKVKRSELEGGPGDLANLGDSLGKIAVYQRAAVSKPKLSMRLLWYLPTELCSFEGIEAYRPLLEEIEKTSLGYTLLVPSRGLALRAVRAERLDRSRRRDLCPRQLRLGSPTLGPRRSSVDRARARSESASRLRCGKEDLP
ncbi:hypothetical protein Q5P01_000099 [Channa striata]|uniref:Uncharacterized protein n=1 Tax=Channa striata TaxID=64152 RepID=A0AA88LM22_CHASR|nr:hypothetical protein Q5P01_000099 [Channa striata]